jgi:uncharacterized protein (TIGR03437 family)
LTPSILKFFAIPPALILSLIPAPTAHGQITIDTFAGGVVRSGVSAQNVAFGLINGVTRDANGNRVFCDSSNNVIRRINADGTIQTIAGVGIPGYGGDGGPATSALLNRPSYAKYDAAGNLYFADAGNYRIRRVDTSGAISTVAGTGIQGTLGSDGPATQAQINNVVDLAIDKSGYVYFAEPGYAVNLVGNPAEVRRITPSGKIELYAGCATCGGVMNGVPATQSGFSFVQALATDPAGNLYISIESQVVRVSPDGVLHMFAGFGPSSASNMGNGGPAMSAPPSDFIALTTDAAGNVYTAETSLLPIGDTNGGFIIRQIGTNGVINQLAGSFAGNGADDGPALEAFLSPNGGFGLTADTGGTITFAEDYGLHQVTTQGAIQKVAPNSIQLTPDGTAAADSWFAAANSIAFDGAGNLYIGEVCAIQKIDTSGQVSTVAGTGQCSTTPPSGPALTTDLTEMWSIAVDREGQVFMADVNGAVYEVTTSGVISSLGSIPQGMLPKIAVDSEDRVYLISFEGVFARITAGAAPEIIAQPPSPFEPNLNALITVDSSDNVYVCCAESVPVLYTAIERYTPTLSRTAVGLVNSPFVDALAVDASSNIWQGAPQGLTKGTLAFGAGCCFYGDGGAAESAYIPTAAMAFAPNGDLYVVDSLNNRIRRIHGTPPSVAPQIAAGGIVNAASLAGGAIAPGELISIFGSNFGPSGLDVAMLQNNAVPKALNNVHVYFGGSLIPGAITARTENQINVFVPYEIANATSEEVTVDVDSVLSTPVTVPVAQSAFGLSTADASGSGQGAILNQDDTFNSDANPAARGSIVTMYGTGEGVTTPALPDGALEISVPYSTTQPLVTVSFGGRTAEVQYAGAAPFLPTGVFQINATIPTTVTPGAVPITVSIGEISTTRTVTVAVQ